MTRQIVTTLFAALSLSISSIPTAAHAALQRVGPTVPANGYPAWYQDSTGLTLDFCSPVNDLELQGGWCLLLPADLAATPEVFPTNFSEEHFYWSGGSLLDLVNGSRATLTLGLEGAFGVGPVAPNDQIVFGRVRVSIPSLPFDGTYIVYTPYGVYTFPDEAAGNRLFFTEDIGFNCAAGTFDCALASSIGPFLLPSATPGGAELPPIPLLQAGQDPFWDALGLAGQTPYPATGMKYVADPAREGPVTGSPLAPFVSAVDGLTRDHNIFRIEVLRAGAATPELVAETYNFALTGRIFEGAIPGHVTVHRATYYVPVATSPTAGQLDVYATAFPGISPRVPGGAPPATNAAPVLVFYDEACALDPATGFPVGPPPLEPAHQMFSEGSDYWGQSPPCDVDPVTGQVIVPAQACVAQTNAVGAGGGVVTVYYPVNVTDDVTVSEATYDPATTTLTVAASSSDLVDPPTLNLTDFGALTAGVWTSAGLPPPATAQVVSTALRPLAFGNKGGIGEMQVTTSVAAVQAPPVPVANNDLATAVEDAPAMIIDVLANDAWQNAPIPAGATVTLAGAARLGTAVANADGTFSYTPNPNASGADGFSYQVAVVDPVSGATLTSNIGGVSVLITNVNDAPVAADDVASAVASFAQAIDVFVNDSDVDGAADLVAAVNLAQTSGPGVATITATGGVVSFLAPAAGTYTFTYQAQDGGGGVTPVVPLLSNVATVTVTVAGAETITITPPAQFRADQARWTINGTATPAANQTLTISYADGPNAGFVIGTVPVVAGAYAFDVRGVTGLFNPTIAGATAVTVTGPSGGSATAPISLK